MSTARVLIVDDDVQTCQLLGSLLESDGFAVQVVNGGDPSLVERAVEAAQHHRPHVIIVDLRLQNIEDYSGLDLLHRVESAHCIVYSAHLTPGILRDVHQRLFDFVEKQDSPQLLRTGVRRAASVKAAARSDLHIEWHKGTDRAGLARTMAQVGLPEPPPDILDDLVAQLCGEAQQVELAPLQRTQSAPSGVSRTRSAVFLAQTDDLQPTVIKFARRSQIEREEENYQRYIQHRLPARFSARQLKTAKFWDIGGVMYTFMGGEVERLPTFATFYHQQDDPSAIVRPLRFFFNDVWGENYRNRQPLAALSLLEAYDQVFALREHEREINQFVYQMEWPDQLPGKQKNPVAWAFQRAGPDAPKGALQAVTHGDLHGDNLFVDGERAWAIDFERSGPGHILRDFVELEVDILARLVPVDGVEDSHYLELLNKLYALPLVKEEEAIGPGLAHPAAQKALAVIAGLRKVARAIVSYKEEEYLWSTLFDALFVASIATAEPWQRRRALILSAVVCNALR
jgi:CheY-like chemotaxis protein